MDGVDPGARGGELVVVIRGHTGCGLACGFCGYSRDVQRPRVGADPGLLERFADALARFRDESGTSVLVCWLGGEPLEWPALPRLASVFRDRHELRLGVTTHGGRLADRGVRRGLIERWEQVTVSVDGLAGVHDRVRGCPGAFARLRANVARLRAEDGAGRLTLRVNHVLMRDNIDEFDGFCEEMAAWGIRALTFNPLGGNERPEFHRDHCLQPDQVERFRARFPGLRRAMAERGLRLLGSDRWLDRIACASAGKPVPVADCDPGRGFLFVDEQGRASPCPYTVADYGVPIRDLFEPGALAALPARFSHARKRARAPACDDCHATHPFDKFQARVALPVLGRPPVSAGDARRGESGRDPRPGS